MTEDQWYEPQGKPWIQDSPPKAEGFDPARLVPEANERRG